MTTTTTDATDQIHQLRAETAAAVEQRDQLAAGARRAVIDAVNDGVIRRDKADDVLAGWGLEPLPGVWTVSGEANLSYTRMHLDEADARDQAACVVTSKLGIASAGGLQATSVHVTDAVTDDEADGLCWYRISVQVGVRTQLTAASPAEATRQAEALLKAHHLPLVLAGFTMHGCEWANVDGCRDLPRGRQAGPASTVAGPGQGEGLSAARAARDSAVGELARLRRQIRGRMVAALRDGELVGDYHGLVGRVDDVLVRLGLAGLTRAHHASVTADLVLRVQANSSYQARSIVGVAMQAATGGSSGRSTAEGWHPFPPVDLGGGCWRVFWHHTFEVWSRGYINSYAAVAAAESLVRADLTAMLADCVEVQEMTIAGTDEGFGVGPLVDSDAD